MIRLNYENYYLMNKRNITIVVIVLLCAIAASVFVFTPREKNLKSVETINDMEPGITIISFGDSLTAGYGLPQDEAYPAQLEKALRDKGYDVKVINSGVSGETTRGNMERAQFIRSKNPDIVILGIGGNDALRFLPIEDVRQNMISTIDILKGGINPPVIVLLQVKAPLNTGLEYKQKFDSLYTTIAKDKDLVLVPFVTEDIFFNPENKLSDGIHYNKTGYQKVIEKYLLPEVEDLVDGLIKR